jgi:hypothetical protein
LDDLLCCDTKGDEDRRGNEEGMEIGKEIKREWIYGEGDRDRGEMEIVEGSS